MALFRSGREADREGEESMLHCFHRISLCTGEGGWDFLFLEVGVLCRVFGVAEDRTRDNPCLTSATDFHLRSRVTKD